MATRIVDYFEEEVRYSGSFNDYSVDDFFKMAIAKQEKSMNFEPEFTAAILAEHAEAIDGQVEVMNSFPCNKVATVKWSYIRKEVE